nr:uncharacterized protein LOC102456559 isoform X2 [Pelodiscus sinensis]|eukprot:XP_025044440.1 uncharacterized protein LOC102456559 isoform X2 [Pelodiscus sinensis]
MPPAAGRGLHMLGEAGPSPQLGRGFTHPVTVSLSLFSVTPDTTPNGLQCPTCFALNFAACNSQITPCTGQETYCLNYFGFLTQGASRSPFQAQGCASTSAQEIKPGRNLTVAAYTFQFYWGSSGPAQPIPTSPSIPSTATTTPPRSGTARAANATLTATKTSKPTMHSADTSTTKGGSPALGTVPFALYLPGLMGLLLVKLLS